MHKPRIRWHIAVFLAPAVLVYTAVMIFPLFNTLRLALYTRIDRERVFVGLDNFRTLFLDPVWSEQFWNALRNNLWFFIVHMLVQNPIGIALAAVLSSPRLRFAAFYRTAIFVKDKAQRQAAEAAVAEAEAALGQKIVTPVLNAKTFWIAEDYHQDYYKGTDIILTRAGPKKQSNAYKFYRKSCGRDARVRELWGAQALTH